MAQQIKNHGQRLKSSRLWRRVVWWVIHDISKIHSVFTTGPGSYISEPTNPCRWRHSDPSKRRKIIANPGRLNLQQHRPNRHGSWNNQGVGVASNSTKFILSLINIGLLAQMLTHTITQNRITEGTPITYVCVCCSEGTASAVQIHSSFIRW
jgi:hypothetical protein